MSESCSFSGKKAYVQRGEELFQHLVLPRIRQDILDIGTKFKPLLRTNFSASESGRFSDIVATVLRLSSDKY